MRKTVPRRTPAIAYEGPLWVEEHHVEEYDDPTYKPPLRIVIYYTMVVIRRRWRRSYQTLYHVPLDKNTPRTVRHRFKRDADRAWARHRYRLQKHCRLVGPKAFDEPEILPADTIVSLTELGQKYLDQLKGTP